jgi:DNA-directed RNA polymerase beta' subunit
MKLQELMHFEEKLLLCEYNNKFTMPFVDYIILDKFLSEVENITNLYFQLMDDYKRHINKEDISNEERIAKMNEYNEKLLNENVEFNFDVYNDFVKRYIDKK